GHLGPDRCRNLPRRCGRHPVGAEGGWWMIGGALQDQGSRLPLIVADITIEPTFADGLPLFQRSSCAYQIKSMTYTGEGWTSDPSPPPHSHSESVQGPRSGPFFFLFQRTLAGPSALRRLGA